MEVTDDERRKVAERLRESCVWSIVGKPVEGKKHVFRFIDMDDLARALGEPEPSDMSGCLELKARLSDLIEPERVTGETSDGYHTFDELYDHRAKLFSVVVRDHRELAWKSMLHHDGTMYDGMFIVGVETPRGQATYHYDVDPYWDVFDCEELDRAPEWDGHTPAQAIDRIAALEPSCDREALLELADELETYKFHISGRAVAEHIREACGEAVA